MSWSTAPTPTIRRLPAARPTWRGGWFAIKHAVDLAVAVLAVLVLAPLLLAIAPAVRLSSPGPVQFRQRRVGRDGHIFDAYKFRSMRDEPTDRPFEPAAGVAPGGVEGTDRRTRIGHWLRASSSC